MTSIQWFKLLRSLANIQSLLGVCPESEPKHWDSEAFKSTDLIWLLQTLPLEEISVIQNKMILQKDEGRVMKKGKLFKESHLAVMYDISSLQDTNRKEKTKTHSIRGGQGIVRAFYYGCNDKAASYSHCNEPSHQTNSLNRLWICSLTKFHQPASADNLEVILW